LFDALGALRSLNRIDAKYLNIPATELAFDNPNPTSVGGILDMANSRLFGFWNHLTEGLRTGSPQNEAKLALARFLPPSLEARHLAHVADSALGPHVTFRDTGPRG